jgi:hypothetical protein
LGKGTNNRLTSEGDATSPIWTHDGKQVLFGLRKVDSIINLFRRPYDGSSPKEPITTSQNNLYAGSPLPDGKTLAGVEVNKETGADIVLLDTGSGSVKPFLNSEFWEVLPEFSPDGRWIAYTSNESDRREVYVRPYPVPATKYQISNAGGTQPLWARNGKQLFYRLEDQVWVVDVRTEGGFAASKPRIVFEKPGYQKDCAPLRCYDLSLDGQRFLMVKEEHGKHTPVTEMILVQNWFELLKRILH